MMDKEKRHLYEQTCSRCGGTQNDPDDENLICDACEDGKEIFELTEDEAKAYPNAKRVK